MFYSHTFLARKGPLGTVWCAAHLQHKLKKSHYISTNVPSTAERIMFPQVPIALRMSAHLLLGVVRIYSKQVDYLHEDCNEIRITINRVFTTVSVNLPHDATHAPSHSVTLPEKLNLDTLDLDDYYKDLGEDSHFKSHADITLTEQIPTGKDPYIIIHFDERDMRASYHTEDDSGSRIGPTPMDEDAPPSVVLHTPAGLKDPSSSNHLGADDRNVGDTIPKKSNGIGIMLDASHGFNFNNSPILPDRAAPDKFLEEQINKDNETFTPAMEDIPLPDGHLSTSHTYHEEQHSIGLLSSPTLLLGGPSPIIELRPSPPVAQPKIQRKRKQYFDEVTVLSNRCMKNTLNDTSNIRRVKRECPSSALAIWKQHKRLRLRKEDVTFEPFITGTCAEIQALYKEDYILAKFQLANTDETRQETNVAQTPTHDSNIEIEIRRDNKCPSPDRLILSSSTPVPSTAGRSCFTPKNSNFGLGSELMETAGRDGPLPMEDMGPSGHLDSEMQTPDTFYGKGLHGEHTVLSDIPELVSSAAGELRFLEEDDYSPSGTQATPGIGLFSNSQEPPELQALPSRTRAVAQYLRRQSSMTPILVNSEESPEDLSLNKILDGKPVKVLKTHGLVDAHQENPYDNITLKVTTKLSKGEFSV
ncbi:hypothetical protein OROGR_004007 [Orobanche gracilis]